MSDMDRLQLTLDEDIYHDVLSGIDPAAEANNRRWAAFLIVDACVLLELPRSTCATAQVLLHRYYCRVPMSGHDPLIIMTMACLFLATKIEESRRKIRDMLAVFHNLLNSYYGLPESVLDINSNQYVRWRSSLLSSEQSLLSGLGFMVYTSHPHKFLLSYIQRLNGGRNLAQFSWNFINDFQTTVDSLRYSPETIASASIMFAARTLQLPLPQSPPWYELFGSTKDDLLRICTLMAKIYQDKHIAYMPLNEADRVAFQEIENDHRMLIESEQQRVEAEQRSSPSVIQSNETEFETGSKKNVSRRRSRSRSRNQEQGRRRSLSRSRSPSSPRGRDARYSHRRRTSRSRSRDHSRRRSRNRCRSRSYDESSVDKHNDDRPSRYDRRASYERKRR